MNEAQLYSQNKNVQETDALYVLDTYLRLVKWKKGERHNILDIGCGDGGIMMEVLKPRLPDNFERFVGVDVSKKMLEFARNTSKDSRVYFKELDIGSELIPQEFHGQFDHIFSFYCLHWVPNQRQAMKNIFKMLRPSGDMLVTFIASNPIFDIYEAMAKSEKWSLYMTDVENFISPYQHSKDPETEITTLLKETGFTSLMCRVENRDFTFPNFKVLSKCVQAVNPFLKRLPISERENHIDDYCHRVRNCKGVSIESYDNNNDEKIHFTYKLFVAYASKPL